MAIAGIALARRRGGHGLRARARRVRGIRLPHRLLRRGLRPRAPLVHDDARAARLPRAGAVAARRHVPARHVHRPVRRGRACSRSSATSTRRSGSSAACLVATVLLVLLGPDPEKQLADAAPDASASRDRRRHRRGRHRLDPDRRAASGVLPHDVAVPAGAVAARPGRGIPLRRPLRAPGRAAAVGRVDRPRRADDRARRRHLGRDRLRPLLRERAGDGPVRPALGRAAGDGADGRRLPRPRVHARPRQRGDVVRDVRRGARRRQRAVERHPADPRRRRRAARPTPRRSSARGARSPTRAARSRRCSSRRITAVSSLSIATGVVGVVGLLGALAFVRWVPRFVPRDGRERAGVDAVLPQPQRRAPLHPRTRPSRAASAPHDHVDGCRSRRPATARAPALPGHGRSDAGERLSRRARALARTAWDSSRSTRIGRLVAHDTWSAAAEAEAVERAEWFNTFGWVDAGDATEGDAQPGG